MTKSTTTSVATTLCVPPRPGELCAPVDLTFTKERTFLEITSRHRVTNVRPDEQTGHVELTIEITDPSDTRSIHVRFDLLPRDAEVSGRSRLLAEFSHDDVEMSFYGTYLGVVSDEN